jgi:hypothetical protein
MRVSCSSILLSKSFFDLRVPHIEGDPLPSHRTTRSIRLIYRPLPLPPDPEPIDPPLEPEPPDPIWPLPAPELPLDPEPIPEPLLIPPPDPEPPLGWDPLARSLGFHPLPGAP